MLWFEKRLQNPSGDEILNALPYAEKLKWGGRGSHEEYIQSLFYKLTSSEHQEELSEGLLSSNIRTRRILIYEKLYQFGHNMKELSYIFLKDKHPINRVLALQYLYDIHEEDILSIVVKMLLDRNAMIRKLAQNIVSENAPKLDIRAFYIENIKWHTLAAILGLGEIGQISDTEKMRKYLCDSRTSVVRSAMVCLMRLDKAKYSDVIAEMLDDSRVGIAKTAQQLIIKNGLVNYNRIYQIFHNTILEHTKIKCATILFSASKWQCIIYMLEALSCNEEIIRELALWSIKKWLSRFNRSFVQITERQKNFA